MSEILARPLPDTQMLSKEEPLSVCLLVCKVQTTTWIKCHDTWLPKASAAVTVGLTRVVEEEPAQHRPLGAGAPGARLTGRQRQTWASCFLGRSPLPANGPPSQGGYEEGTQHRYGKCSHLVVCSEA